MVPLFISLWGIEKYADWIIITALSSFFTMTNLGLNQATNNEFVIRYQNKEYDKCNKLLSNSSVFILMVGLFIVLILYFIDFIWGFKHILNVSIFNANETTATFLFLLVNIFLKMYGGIYAGIYRVTSKAHLNSLIDNITRIFELVILLTGIILGFNIIIIICCFNIPALISIGLRHYQANKWFTIDVFKFSNFDWTILSTLIKPSLAFMLIPLGLAISNQGIVFLVKAYLGASVLVSFSTTRTLINFIKTGTTLISSSIYPEISNAYAKKDAYLVNKIYNKSYMISFLMLGILLVFFLIFGKSIFLFWTKNAVEFYSSLFYGLLVAVIISSLWNIPSTILTSTNNHNAFSVFFIMAQGLAICLIYLILTISPHVFYIPAVILFSEICILYYTHKKAKATLKLL